MMYNDIEVVSPGQSRRRLSWITQSARMAKFQHPSLKVLYISLTNKEFALKCTSNQTLFNLLSEYYLTISNVCELMSLMSDISTIPLNCHFVSLRSLWVPKVCTSGRKHEIWCTNVFRDADSESAERQVMSFRFPSQNGGSKMAAVKISERHNIASNCPIHMILVSKCM